LRETIAAYGLVETVTIVASRDTKSLFETADGAEGNAAISSLNGFRLNLPGDAIERSSPEIWARHCSRIIASAQSSQNLKRKRSHLTWLSAILGASSHGFVSTREGLSVAHAIIRYDIRKYRSAGVVEAVKTSKSLSQHCKSSKPARTRQISSRADVLHRENRSEARNQPHRGYSARPRILPPS
jgi:hypothetical protein